MTSALPESRLDGGRNGVSVSQPPDTPATPSRRLTPLATAPIFAVQFLTIVPPVLRRPPRPDELGASELFFPVTGVLLGTMLAGADLLLGMLVAPAVRDVLLVGLLAVATGALHLDGVVDTFDGLFAQGGPDRRLAIMRDPRAGTFGVVAVVCLLLLKVAALGALTPDLRTGALVLAPCLGRWAIVLATWRFTYARPEGLGRAFKDGIRARHVVGAALVTAVVAYLAAGWLGLIVVAGATAAVLAVGAFMASRLGGLTGDTYGALCELTELSVWLACGLRIAGGPA